MAPTDPSEGNRLIRALRLRQQGLVPGVTGWSVPADVAQGMVAMQGQDFGGVKHALALRCGPLRQRPDEAAVTRAFASGEVVRNRPSRGTLQVTAPEDLHWLTGLLSPRSNAAGMARRGDLGITQEMVDGRSGPGPQSNRSRPRSGQRSGPARRQCPGQPHHAPPHRDHGHRLRPAGRQGRTFVLADEWIGDGRVLDGGAALAEVATRYFTARGPATLKDFSWWSNLTMGDVRKAIDLAGGALGEIEINSVTYSVAAGTTSLTESEIDQALAEPLLLPSFDEYLLGYTERGAVLDPDHRCADRARPQRDVPGHRRRRR